jgi:hypothetical protein
LLLDLVAMLNIDVHGKWTAGSAGPLASGARFSSRHCKGVPATPFPPLQMISTTISPISCFAPVEYWQNTSQNVDRPAVGCNLVVLKSALPQSHCKIQAPNPATPYEQFNSFVLVYR